MNPKPGPWTRIRRWVSRKLYPDDHNRVCRLANKVPRLMDEVNGLRYALAETRRPSEQIERLAEAVESVGNLNMHLDRRSTLFVHVPMDAIVYRTDPDKIINMQIRDVSVRVYGASLAVGLHAEESALPANAMRELLRGIVVSAAMKAADETPIPDMKDVA